MMCNYSKFQGHITLRKLKSVSVSALRLLQFAGAAYESGSSMLSDRERRRPVLHVQKGGAEGGVSI